MADPIDPRLFASSLPPRQAYTAAPQHSAGHPYYHQQPPHLAQPAPLGAALDPALETSPTGPEESPEEYEHEDDDGDHDGCAIHARALRLYADVHAAITPRRGLPNPPATASGPAHATRVAD
jgi:hypothetical protein